MATATERFNGVFLRTLQSAADSLADDVAFASLPSYDSFSAILLITEIEKEFDIRFTVTEIAAIETVGDLRVLIRRKGVAI